MKPSLSKDLGLQWKLISPRLAETAATTAQHDFSFIHTYYSTFTPLFDQAMGLNVFALNTHSSTKIN